MKNFIVFTLITTLCLLVGINTFKKIPSTTLKRTECTITNVSLIEYNEVYVNLIDSKNRSFSIVDKNPNNYSLYKEKLHKKINMNISEYDILGKTQKSQITLFMIPFIWIALLSIFLKTKK